MSTGVFKIIFFKVRQEPGYRESGKNREVRKQRKLVLSGDRKKMEQKLERETCSWEGLIVLGSGEPERVCRPRGRSQWKRKIRGKKERR